MKSRHQLADTFLAHLGEDVNDVDRAALQEALSAVVASAAQRWEPIEVKPVRFITYLAGHLEAPKGDVLDAIGQLHIGSLYLACACADGNEIAIERLEQNFFGAVRPALARLDKTGTITDDALQALRERLFLSKPDRPAKIADYAGRGELRLWVRAVAVRIALDLLRVVKREHRGRDDDDVINALPDWGDDPELAYLREHYGETLRAALAQVLESLPARDRSVLRCHFVDRLNIEQIGRIYQVHKTTAFRWLEKARSSLVKSTRLRMKQALGVRTAELDSVMRLLDFDLHLSLQRLLKTKTADGKR